VKLSLRNEGRKARKLLELINLDIFSNYFNLRAYPNLVKNDYAGILRVQKLSINHHATYIHTYIHACIDTYILHTYIHTYIRTGTHTIYMHTYTHTCRLTYNTYIYLYTHI
jgi:hypothetical protein